MTQTYVFTYTQWAPLYGITDNVIFWLMRSNLSWLASPKLFFHNLCIYKCTCLLLSVSYCYQFLSLSKVIPFSSLNCTKNASTLTQRRNEILIINHSIAPNLLISIKHNITSGEIINILKMKYPLGQCQSDNISLMITVAG